MENNILTVDGLIDKLNNLSRSGYGDMKIKCQDHFIHEDEIGFNYIAKEVLIRGMLYNFPVSEKVNEFNEDIQKAYRKYWDMYVY